MSETCTTHVNKYVSRGICELPKNSVIFVSIDQEKDAYDQVLPMIAYFLHFVVFTGVCVSD